MDDIRWLEILASDLREACKHPSAIFINRDQYPVYRVLQVHIGGRWCDVPIVPHIADR